MSVDTSIYIGWGKSLPEDNLLETVIPDFADDPDGAGWEFFEENYPLLELIEVGNYMSGDTEYVLSVKRITDSYDTYDIPGGVLKGPGIPQADEVSQFQNAYQALTGTTANPESFVAVLWS